MFSLLYLGACALDNSEEETDRLSYRDVELSLVDITDADSYSRSVPGWTRGDEVARAVSAPGGAVIKLVAEVDPPEDAQGRLLQASHVALSSNGQYAAVGYMLRGDEASGAIDVFNISNPSKPKLQSTHFFPGFDIAAVLVESGSLFLAGQTPDQSGEGKSARVVSLDFSNSGVVSLSSEKSVQLPGYFATDLSREDDVLFVTTGTYSSNQAAVGIYALDTETLETSESVTTGTPTRGPSCQADPMSRYSKRNIPIPQRTAASIYMQTANWDRLLRPSISPPILPPRKPRQNRPTSRTRNCTLSRPTGAVSPSWTPAEGLSRPAFPRPALPEALSLPKTSHPTRYPWAMPAAGTSCS